LASNLINADKIVTTEAKAKEIRPYVEKLVTSAKAGTVTARRVITSRICNPKSVKKLVEVIAPKYKTRAGGYTRITKMINRGGDGSKMATIEFV
jgi:large subunit ribosomal protein L17